MNETRDLELHEKRLIGHLLAHVNSMERIFNLPTRTRTMSDGGMGSISFDELGKPKRSSDLAVAHYVDAD